MGGKGEVKNTVDECYSRLKQIREFFVGWNKILFREKTVALSKEG